MAAVRRITYDQVAFRVSQLVQPKKLPFAIAIILALGSLAALGVGLAGQFQVGALAQFDARYAIGLMCGSGALAIASVVLWRVGQIKNRDPIIHGSEAWERCGLKIDLPHPPPPIDWNEEFEQYEMVFGKETKTVQSLKEGTIVFYIPEKVSYNGNICQPTLRLLSLPIRGENLICFEESVKNKFGDTPLPSGWYMINTSTLQIEREPSSEHPYIPKSSFDQASALVLSTGIILHYLMTGERLLSDEQVVVCTEKIKQKGDLRIQRLSGPLVVGNFTNSGLTISFLAKLDSVARLFGNIRHGKLPGYSGMRKLS